MIRVQDKQDNCERPMKVVDGGFFVFFKKEEWETNPEKCPDGYGYFRGSFYSDLRELEKYYNILG